MRGCGGKVPASHQARHAVARGKGKTIYGGGASAQVGVYAVRQGARANAFASRQRAESRVAHLEVWV